MYINPDKKIEEYYNRFAQLGIDTGSVTPIKPELEDLFIQLMKLKQKQRKRASRSSKKTVNVRAIISEW